jgi:hypothetical protein
MTWLAVPFPASPPSIDVHQTDEEVRRRFVALTSRRLVRACVQLEPVTEPRTLTDAALCALGNLARRYEALEAEAAGLDA